MASSPLHKKIEEIDITLERLEKAVEELQIAVSTIQNDLKKKRKKMKLEMKVNK